VRYPCGILPDISRIDYVVLMGSTYNWATFEKVDADVELVMRELREVVVAGYDWEAVLGDVG
jgi:hypothetical protein